VLFLSVVDKAQVILFSAGAVEQPESVHFGGTLLKMALDTAFNLEECNEILDAK
jgi:hypothetical protein